MQYALHYITKWHKQIHPFIYIMMTSSNGNIFRVTGTLCGEFTGPGEFPTQRPVTRSFDVFFDLRLNKRLSKQPWCGWFEMPSWSLWRHCNDIYHRPAPFATTTAQTYTHTLICIHKTTFFRFVLYLCNFDIMGICVSMIINCNK